jgi:hypothetical protein
MKQILHIFAKDTRHQWLEVLLSLSFMGALVFTAPSRWRSGPYGVVSYSAFGLFENLQQFLVLIIPLTWWLLISPLIHDESLVGDRQFWITRPYQWQKLLAAKVLFLIVFLFVPLVLAQLAMLARAGFAPFSCMPGLLYDMLLLTCVFVLPLLVFATVTRTFARMTLAILGGLACAIVIRMLAGYGSQDRAAIPHEGTIALCLIISICIAVVLIQYARRQATFSWILLGIIVVLFAAFSMGGAPDNAFMRSTYPPSAQASAPAQLQYRGDVGPTAFVLDKGNRVQIVLPTRAFGVAEGSIVILNYLRVSLEATDGSHWTSVWQSAAENKLFPGELLSNERFTMPRPIYDSLRGKSLSVNLEFALTEARAAGTTQVVLRQQDFAVSGLGVCTPLTGFLDHAGDIAGLTCRAPLRQPQLTLIDTTWTDTPCAAPAENAKNGIKGSAWVGALERPPADIGIVPVWYSYIGFTNQQKIENNQVVGTRTMCSGTAMTFTAYRLSRRAQISVSISGFQLPELNRIQQAIYSQN